MHGRPLSTHTHVLKRTVRVRPPPPSLARVLLPSLLPVPTYPPIHPCACMPPPSWVRHMHTHKAATAAVTLAGVAVRRSPHSLLAGIAVRRSPHSLPPLCAAVHGACPVHAWSTSTPLRSITHPTTHPAHVWVWVWVRTCMPLVHLGRVSRPACSSAQLTPLCLHAPSPIPGSAAAMSSPPSTSGDELKLPYNLRSPGHNSSDDSSGSSSDGSAHVSKGCRLIVSLPAFTLFLIPTQHQPYPPAPPVSSTQALS